MAHGLDLWERGSGLEARYQNEISSLKQKGFLIHMGNIDLINQSCSSGWLVIHPANRLSICLPSVVKMSLLEL